jgi:hypothetical protein
MARMAEGRRLTITDYDTASGFGLLVAGGDLLRAHRYPRQGLRWLR